MKKRPISLLAMLVISGCCGAIVPGGITVHIAIGVLVVVVCEIINSIIVSE